MWGLIVIAIVLPLFGLSVLGSAAWLLFTEKEKRAKVLKTISLLYAAGFVGFILLFMTLVVAVGMLQTWSSPMTVDRKDIIGTYCVDKAMFAGAQADWQHEHYRLTITEQDTLILRSLNDRGVWHMFKRPIIPVEGGRSYLWRFPTEGDSTVHHIITNTPTLHRQQWGFYYSFRSPRYGNVFFRKEE